jgi:DNA-binding NtrC family response regulator
MEIYPDINVLLSSGYGLGGQAGEILERGCSGFIQKPFDMKRLSRKTGKVIDKR